MSSPNPKLKLSDYVVVHLPDGLSQCQINDVRCAGLTTDIPLPFFFSDACKTLREAHDNCVCKIFIRPEQRAQLDLEIITWRLKN